MMPREFRGAVVLTAVQAAFLAVALALDNFTMVTAAVVMSLLAGIMSFALVVGAVRKNKAEQ